jgi:hypothetical protein
LVFGIGFNGQLFGVPHHSPEDDDAIYLTFSSGARKPGGYLSLYFIKQLIAINGKMTHPLVLDYSPLTADKYYKYHHLI